ncbi:MAG: cyclase family protein [Oscillospiraceae bacterium]
MPCLHNGTHMDAPRHFVPDGTDAAHVLLDACIGECSVVNFDAPSSGGPGGALPGLRSGCCSRKDGAQSQRGVCAGGQQPAAAGVEG